MRLATFTDPGTDPGTEPGTEPGTGPDADRLGVVTDAGIVDVTAVVRARTATPGLSAMRSLAPAWDALRDAIAHAARSAPPRPLTSVRLGPPVPDPGTVFAAPVNYHDHMTEMSETSHVGALGVFLKAPSSVIGTGATVQLPYTDRRFDQEGELAVVIGREARHVDESTALDHVLGYTGLFDITMRGGEDRSVRKSFATFTPMGPWLVTPDEFGDPTDVDLRCSVNGEVRQLANTRDLIWSVAALIAYVSSVTTLRPGDVITTGTPAGVGQIVAGDVVELELSGLGPLRVTTAADHAVPCPTTGAGRGPVPPPTVTPVGSGTT